MTVPTDPSDWTTFIPFGSALLGAAVGALTAQWIAARNKSIDDRSKEVRASHAAATLTYSAVTDVFLSVKIQNIKPACDRYEAGKKELLQQVKNRKSPDDAIDFHADMQTMDIVRVPLDALQKIMVERISAPTRALALVAVLDRTVHGLNNYLKMRNEMCDDFRKNGVHPAIFYGFRTPNGTDERYSSTMKVIGSYTDDAIHFSRELADELVHHTNQEKAKLPRRQRRSASVIVSADFSKVTDMFPDRKNYSDWDTMFVQAPPPAKGKWWPWRKST